MSFDAGNRFLQLSGTPVDRARQKGLAFRDSHDELVQSLIDSPLIVPWLKPFLPHAVVKTVLGRLGKKYLNLHRPILQNYYGRNLFAELEGLAEGFDMPVNYIYGLNAIEILSSKIPFSLGCTALAFAANHTNDGKPRLAYNHDFPHSFGKSLYVQETRPAEGMTTLMLTYPSILGGIAGLNSAGLAVVLNHAYATDMQLLPALPITWLLSECLQRCDTVAAAVELILKTPVPNGSFLTLIDCHGARAVVEVSGTRKEVRQPDESVLCTFNFYRCAALKSHEVPWMAKTTGMAKLVFGERLVHAHNMGRERRFIEFFDHAKKHDNADIHEFMADHSGHLQGAIDTICRHDERAMNTIASVILNPAAQTMKVIFGWPCQGQYLDFCFGRS